MRKKIWPIFILVIFLLGNISIIPVSSEEIVNTSEIESEEENGFKQDDSEIKLFPLTDEYLYDLENGIYPELDQIDSNDEGSEKQTSNLANIKVVFEPPWHNYDNSKYKDKWGVSDCWQEDVVMNGEYHKTTCHAWAGPGAGYASISVSLKHYDGFSPPKDATYSFKYYMNMQGTIKLESMTLILGSSAARGGAGFYFYLWDGETISFEKSMTFEDHYSIAGVGNGQYPYNKDYTYSNSASLKKGVHYTFGVYGRPWILCDGFVECPAWADHWVDWEGLKKLEIEWPNSSPGTPEFNSPSDGATGISTSPNLQWSCCDPDGIYDSLKYDIYLGTSSSPSLVKSGLTSSSYSASSLKANTKYYWKITAIDSKGSSKTSSVWSFTTKSGCCFPAGTKITMADGTYKNIEDVKVGDKILSYDVEKGRFTSWRVKMLGNPIHPLITINDGLIQATVDHPFYIKKTNGETGWAAYDAASAKQFTSYKGNILTMEVGSDQLYTSDKGWIDITNITYTPEPIQTYNLLSFSGTKTYFANDILVYEEHPPGCILDWLFRLFGEKFPNFLKTI